MNQYLQNFYGNIGQREAVKLFMVEVLGEMAVERAFAGKPVVGIAEAKELVDKTFDKLDEIYGKIEPSEPLSAR
jgi:hypothetical protein